MGHNQNQNPWSIRQGQPHAPAQDGPMGFAAPQVTPDMTYPSYPNPAGLGSQVPFEEDPVIVPVDSYQDPMQMQAPPMETSEEPEASPWSMIREQENGF